MTRDVEWDDLERAKIEGFIAYRASICDCGLPDFIAETDPRTELVFRTCPICAGRDRQLRVLHAREKAEVKKAHGDEPPPGAELPSDGRSISLRLKPPAPPPAG